jgi:hypothetical protein
VRCVLILAALAGLCGCGLFRARPPYGRDPLVQARNPRTGDASAAPAAVPPPSAPLPPPRPAGAEPPDYPVEPPPLPPFGR